MSTISVDLPPDLMEFVAAKVDAGQYRSVGDYLVALIDAARQKRSSIETALLEGIESGPPLEWTQEQWQEIRDRVTESHQQG